jgi:exodeoxyribonuclease VII large subunit
VQPFSNAPTEQEIYTVSQLNLEARMIMEEAFQHVWIVGEISNLARPTSGHFYFTLKDNQAQVRCALFRITRRRLTFAPENGQQVLVKAQVSIYEARGDFQLIIADMQLAGHGALQIAFEKLKQKLSQEGLFDEAHKKPLPKFPQTIGVITSTTGAAIRDIIKVLNRRFSLARVIIYPTQVQGEAATPQIINAIKIANQRAECDILIVARGGGSIEDLWCFNEENVARTIFASEIPMVSGIGHEIDFTIADFVADHRAPTPSAAAELVSPNTTEIMQYLIHQQQKIVKFISAEFRHFQHQLQHLQKRLRDPKKSLQEYAQRLDNQEQRLLLLMKHFIEKSTSKLTQLSATLDAVSPLKTLERGFAIVTKDNKIIRDSKQVSIQDKLKVKLAKGDLNCQVITTE